MRDAFRTFGLLVLTAACGRLYDDAAGDRERGDVPGWVLVTLMTAGLVITIWALAGTALQNVFETAIQRVLAV